MWCFDTGHAVCKVALSADGQTLVSRSWDGDIKIWNRNGQNWWYCHTLHEKRDSMAHMLIGNCDPMALSADGQTLVSGSWGGDIKIWKVKTGKLCHTFHGNYNSVALSADGQTLVSRDKNTIKIWDLQEWQCRRTLNEPFNSVALSANGQTMVSSNKNTIKIWGVK
jgi:WD40 repeat protein